MVVTTADAELSTVATTGEVDVVVVCETVGADGLHPVGVVVEVLILGEGGVVIELFGVGGGAALCGVEVRLLKKHGVVVAVQQVEALGHPCLRETIAVGDSRLSTRTTLCLNHDNTVGTTATPDGAGRGVLQYFDAFDVFGVHGQQLGEALFVSGGEVEVSFFFRRHFEDVVVDDDKGLGITRDGGGTTQTHLSTGTKVTRVEHDVKTGNLSLQGLVDRSEGETFHLAHAEFLLGDRYFSVENVKTVGLVTFLGDDLNNIEGGVVLHLYIKYGTRTYI